MRTLHQCLLDVGLVRLRAIARFWGLEPPARRGPEAAAHLAEALSDPEAVIEARDALPEDQRQALDALLAAGGWMPLRVFTREWGEIRAMGAGRMERERPWRKPASTAEGLWYTGFIARTFQQEGEATFEVVFVPPELRDHLPLPETAPPKLALAEAPEPAIVRSAGAVLLDDACTLLAYVQNVEVNLRPGGSWPPQHVERLTQYLRSPDARRFAFLRHLMRHTGWQRAGDGERLRLDPGPVTDWLQSSTHEQRSALAAAWRDDPTWNDLFHVPTLQPEDTGAWRNDPLLARAAILGHLRACVPGAWYQIDDFAAAIKEVDPDFQRPDGDYASWYVRDAASGVYLSGFESWPQVEGALIRYLIASPLAWLGLIDLGATAPAAPSGVFRLTPAGAAFLGLADLPAEPAPASFTLRSGFVVLAPPARRYDRFQLSRVADLVASPALEGADEGDGRFVYRLTPASLARAGEQGIAVPRVLEFLDRIGGDAPVPRAFEAALARWEARGSEASLERGVLLRLSDEALMTEIAAAPSTRRLIVERVGPSVALISERDWPRLVAALGELGVLCDIASLEGEYAA